MRSKRTVGIVLAALVITDNAGAQAVSGIKMRAQEHVSKADAKSAHYESHLAIDPLDPKHMIAIATVQWRTVKLNSEGRWVNKGANVFVTFDGGSHWKLATIADPALKAGGDGTVYISPRGTAFMVVGVHLKGKSVTIIGASADGGRTFHRRVVLPYRDRPWLAFDTSGNTDKGVFDGAIYLVGQKNGMVVSRSTDGGQTWSVADHLRRDEGGPAPDIPVSGIPGDMLVTPDGNAVITYAASRAEPTRVVLSRGDSVSVTRLDFLVSDDGGRRWFGVRRGPLIHNVRDYRHEQTVQAIRSAVDNSHGRWRGRIYSVWPEYDEHLDRYVVRTGHTDDVGKTWATTVVSDSAMRGATSNISVAVNRDGIVAVAWYDRRDDPQGLCWRLYAAISVDGGDHFEPNQRLSGAATCTNTPGNWPLSAWSLLDVWTDPSHPRPSLGITAFVPVRFANGGETLGLAADRDGIFHAAWINGVTGVMQLWHTSFEVDEPFRAKARPAVTGTLALTAIKGRKEDLSLELTLEVNAPRIDFERGVLEVTLRVVNPTTRSIRAPIDVVLEDLILPNAQAMGLKGLRIVNADNRIDGVGATWSFVPWKGSVIPPSAKSAPRVIRFEFQPGIPERPRGYLTPRFAIYGSANVP